MSAERRVSATTIQTVGCIRKLGPASSLKPDFSLKMAAFFEAEDRN